MVSCFCTVTKKNAWLRHVSQYCEAVEYSLITYVWSKVNVVFCYSVYSFLRKIGLKNLFWRHFFLNCLFEKYIPFYICLSVVWALFAVDWWARLLYFSSDDYQHWDPQGDLWKTVLASICLDLLLAGSEIFHKIRLVHRKRSVAQEAAHGINSPPPTGYPSAAGPYYAPYPVQAQSVVWKSQSNEKTQWIFTHHILNTHAL